MSKHCVVTMKENIALFLMVFCISCLFFPDVFFFSNHLAFKILNIFPTLKISLSFTYMC